MVLHLVLTGGILAHRPLLDKVPGGMAAPIEQTVGGGSVRQHVAGRPLRGLAKLRLAGQCGHAVQEPQQRLLAGEVADHPGFAVVRPADRLERKHVQAVDEQRRVRLAVAIPAVLEHRGGEPPQRRLVSIGGEIDRGPVRDPRHSLRRRQRLEEGAGQHDRQQPAHGSRGTASCKYPVHGVLPKFFR